MGAAGKVSVITVSMLLFTLMLGALSGISRAEYEAQDVVVSNITPTSFTVSWKTPSATSGYVKYGVGTATTIAYDVRGSGNYYVHYVTITGLSPSTTYAYEIYINGEKATGDGASGDVTTKDANEPTTPFTIYGAVKRSDGGAPSEVVCYA
ncbi:MAG: hypothetical protein DRN20_02770, partial [Thermoplasmata archaeon]